MRNFGENQHRLFQDEQAKVEPDFSQFKEKPLTPNFKVYQVDFEGYAGEMDSFREDGLITVSVLEPGIKKGQLLKISNADVENDYALAVVIEVKPRKLTYTTDPFGYPVPAINDDWGTVLQIVEDIREEIRPLNLDETERFDQHRDVSFPRGVNGIPLPEYVEHYRQHYYKRTGNYLERFFFTIRDANGLIRIAKTSRVSMTEVVFSRAD